MDSGPTLVGQGGATIGTVRVYVVLVEETPGRSVGEWPSSLPGEVCREIAGVALPAGVDDIVKVADADVASLAGPVGTLSLTDHDGTLSPTDLAGLLFPADLAESVIIGVVGLADAGILFPAVSDEILFPPDPADHGGPGCSGAGRKYRVPVFVCRSAGCAFQFGCHPGGRDSGIQWFGSGASSYSGVN